MTQAGSGAYLGGISTMLAQNDVCASCGQIHEERRFALRLGLTRGCPAVVFGTFPTLTGALAVEDEASVPSLIEPPRAAGRRGSMLSVPWPMPTQTEDYL